MDGLVFETQTRVAASAPTRADVACFVGFVPRRAGAIPLGLRRWVDEWGRLGRRDPDAVEALLDIPVPIDGWDIFDRLFAWERRPVAGSAYVAGTYLGAAVRSFFAQGGRKCYVVRVGDPWALRGAAPDEAVIARLIPGYPAAFAGSAVDPPSWRGIGHLFGLTDVSFLCLPDLADTVAAPLDAFAVEEPERPDGGEERFVECSEPVTPTRADDSARRLRAPRCDEDGYQRWARAVRLTADLLARQLPEVQLVAAIPLPLPGTPAERDLLGALTDDGRGPVAANPPHAPNGMASAFVQLAYPWLRTPGSGNLPETLESPDAALVGVLARNALTRGTFRAAANLDLGDVYDVQPVVPRGELHRRRLTAAGTSEVMPGLLERVSVLGPTPSGWRLLSDVTTSLDERHRPASVSRLIATLIRAARQVGEEAVFEPSGARLWADLSGRMTGLLLGLLEVGALRGAYPDEAFQVRCDRSTMSQHDLDAGRAIVSVQLDPAVPIGRITVRLALSDGGRVSLLGTEGVAA